MHHRLIVQAHIDMLKNSLGIRAVLMDHWASVAYSAKVKAIENEEGQFRALIRGLELAKWTSSRAIIVEGGCLRHMKDLLCKGSCLLLLGNLLEEARIIAREIGEREIEWYAKRE